jgi:hypothetical protein
MLMMMWRRRNREFVEGEVKLLLSGSPTASEPASWNFLD